MLDNNKIHAKLRGDWYRKDFCFDIIHSINGIEINVFSTVTVSRDIHKMVYRMLVQKNFLTMLDATTSIMAKLLCLREYKYRFLTQFIFLRVFFCALLSKQGMQKLHCSYFFFFFHFEIRNSFTSEFNVLLNIKNLKC